MQRSIHAYKQFSILLIFITLAPRLQAALPHRGFTVDVQNREDSRNFYNSVYNSSENIKTEWTGDINSCNPGSSSAKHRTATLRRLNYFRAMSGIPADISFVASSNAIAKQAALLASANSALSHHPPSNWKCYSSAGAQASSSSVIALGRTGANAVTAYMEDAGSHNRAVGHRRWLLYPQTKSMGSGEIAPSVGNGRLASAIHVFDRYYGTNRPKTRDEFVSWPVAGYTPYQLMFPRWSFAIPNADFSKATVSVKRNQVSVPLNLLPLENGTGENTLVWEIDPTQLAIQETDTYYDVSINNVLIYGVLSRKFNYRVIAFNPATDSTDAVYPSITGPTTTELRQITQYRVSGIPGIQQYQTLKAGLKTYTTIHTAEAGIQGISTQAATSQTLISNFTSYQGTHAYYLSHHAGVSQQLNLEQQFLVDNNATLEFASRINCAMPDETARIQVSLDDGVSWQDISSQPGIQFGLRETDFAHQSISLDQFAGQIIRLRFNFEFDSGWRCSTSNSGWYLDDIALNHVEVLTNSQVTTLSTTNFSFTPTQAGEFVLAVRPLLFNGFPGQWGNTLIVNADQPIIVQPPIPKQPPNTNTQTVVFRTSSGTTKTCEYISAKLDVSGHLKIVLKNHSCLL